MVLTLLQLLLLLLLLCLPTWPVELLGSPLQGSFACLQWQAANQQTPS
jgi:hypothetical protein